MVERLNLFLITAGGMLLTNYETANIMTILSTFKQQSVSLYLHAKAVGSNSIYR